MKKIKYVLTAVAVFSTLSVAAFASTESTPESTPESAPESTTESTTESTPESAPESSAPAADSNNSGSADGGNVDTGIGSVAAVVGIVTLAGAAVVISRKKS